MENKKTFYEKLNEVQMKLSAPKNQKNDFGNYNYRSCEDIYEGLKQVLKDTGLVVTVTDDLLIQPSTTDPNKLIFIIKAVATVSDGPENSLSSTGYAQVDQHKGMSAEQTFGTASSYARKYALNGLFMIDDNKDADSTEITKADATKNNVKSNAPAKQPAKNVVQNKNNTQKPTGAPAQKATNNPATKPEGETKNVKKPTLDKELVAKAKKLGIAADKLAAFLKKKPNELTDADLLYAVNAKEQELAKKPQEAKK